MADEKKYGIVLTASDQTRAAFDSLNKNLGGVTSGLEGVQNIVKDLLPSIGVLSLAKFAKSAIDAGDEMFILSQKTGIAVEKLAGLEHAAQLNGTSMESAATGVKKLSTYLFEAAAGGKEQTTMLKILGVTAKEPLPALEQIADQFATMTDGAEKSAVAVKLFGKSGLDMIPMLNGGSAALRDMIAEGEKLNPISTEFSVNADALKDNFDRMRTAAKGNAFTFSNELMPTLISVSEELLHAGHNSDIFALAGKGVNEVLKTIVVLGANTIYTFKTIGNEIGGMAAQLNALAHGDFDAFANIRKMMIEDGEAARAEIDRFSESVIKGKEKVEAAAEKPKTNDSVARKIKAAADLVTAEAAAKKANEESEKSYAALMMRINGTTNAASGMSAAMRIVAEMDDTKIHPAQRESLILAAKKADAMEQEKLAYEAQYKIKLDAFNLSWKEQESYSKIIAKMQDEVAAHGLSAQIIATENSMRELENSGLAKGTEEYDRQRAAILALNTIKQAQGQFADPAAAEAQKYAQQIKLADDFAKASQDGAARHAEIIEGIEQAHTAKLVQLGMQGALKRADFEDMTNTRAASVRLAMMQNVIAGAGQHSRAMFNISKGIALAQAAIELPKTVMAAYRSGVEAGGPFGPAVGAAYAAVAFAAQMINMNAIKSAEFGGGSAGSAPSAAGGSIALPGQVANPGVIASADQPVQQEAQKQQVVVNIYNQGTFVTPSEFINNTVIPQIKEQITNADVLIIDPRSRQAQMLAVA